MNQVIQIQVKNVYGVATTYPANEQAKMLAQIAGTKTLKPDTLATAKKMGFAIELVAGDLPQGLKGLVTA